MGAVDYIILAALGSAVILAVRWAWGRRKKGGGCCGGCTGCCESCRKSCPDHGNNKK